MSFAILTPYSSDRLGDGLIEELGEIEAEILELTELDGEIEAEILELGEMEALGLREAEALELGETEAEALEEGEIELEGEIDAEGERLGLAELDGERELEGDTELEGDRDELGEVEALGDSEGEALPPKSVETRLEFSLIGFQIAVKRIRPAVKVSEDTVAIISCETICSATVVESSTEASGELSCQISPASRAVPVVVGKSPPVVMVVPTSRDPEPVKSTSTVA